MGLLDTFKGWFNIGGVKVEMPGFEPVIKRSGDRIVGRVVLTSQADKKVNQMVYRLIQQTTKKGQEGDSRFVTLGELIVGPAFEIKKGATLTFDYAMPYSLEGVAVDPSGKLDPASYYAIQSGPNANPRVTYTVSAVAQVEGALISPTAKAEVAIVD